MSELTAQIEKFIQLNEGALKRNPGDVEASEWIAGILKSALEAVKPITPQRLKDYMAEMGYGWEQAYTDLVEMLDEDMEEIALYDGMRPQLNRQRKLIEDIHKNSDSATSLTMTQLIFKLKTIHSLTRFIR